MRKYEEARERVSSVRRVLHVLIATIFLSAISRLAIMWTQAFAADSSSRIEIVKSLFFERGVGVVPLGIAKTNDGLIVTGSIGVANAWAIRIDESGRVAWRHILPSNIESRTIEKSTYVGSVQLSDESSILCGSAYINHSKVGLITHISKTGQIIRYDIIDATNDIEFSMSDVRYCAPYRDGVVAVGAANGHVEPGNPTGKLYFRAIFLDSNGRFINSQLILNQNMVFLSAFVHNDTVFTVSEGSNPDTENSGMTLVSDVQSFAAADSPLTHRTVNGEALYIDPVRPTNSICLLSELSEATQKHTFTSALRNISLVTGEARSLLATRAYELEDQSIVIFGQKRIGENSYSSSVTWIDLMLRTRGELVFQPIFASDKVGAAAFSGRRGEFVVARGVYPRRAAVAESEPNGLAITYLHIH